MVLARVDVLPGDGVLLALQDLLVQAGLAAAAQSHRPPLAVARDLELHAAPDRLRHAECAPQRLHAQLLARRLPRLQARLEGVCGSGGRGRGEWGGADARTESVVETRGGGCAGGAL